VAAGLLTSKYDTTTKLDEMPDFRAGFPRFSKEFLPLYMPIINWLKDYAAKRMQRLHKLHSQGCWQKVP